MTRRDIVLEPVGTVREIIGNNRLAAYLAAVALAILYATGNLPDVGLPSWWPIVLVAVGGAAAAGRYAAKRIDDLLPDPEGILIVELDTTETGGGAIYELSDEAFEKMRVMGGDLFQWDESSRRVYEVREYDQERNVARANWRESKPGSVFAGKRSAEDAIAAVAELREDYEEDARKAKALRRRVRGVVRQLDKDRARAQTELLDDRTTPDLGDSRPVSEVIEDAMPDDIDLPTEPEAKTNGHAEAPDDDEQSDDPPTMNPFESEGETASE
jgi:hypothetical protein